MQRSEWLSVGLFGQRKYFSSKMVKTHRMSVLMEMVQWGEHRGDTGEEALLGDGLGEELGCRAQGQAWPWLETKRGQAVVHPQRHWVAVWGSWGRQGPGGSSRELAPVASFSLWLGLGAVAEEGRDLGLRSMEKDTPHTQREWAGDSDQERLSL